MRGWNSIHAAYTHQSSTTRYLITTNTHTVDSAFCIIPIVVRKNVGTFFFLFNIVFFLSMFLHLMKCYFFLLRFLPIVCCVFLFFPFIIKILSFRSVVFDHFHLFRFLHFHFWIRIESFVIIYFYIFIFVSFHFFPFCYVVLQVMLAKLYIIKYIFALDV